MRRLLVLVAFLGSCGDEKQAKENPTNCALKEVENGTEFTCTDKDGKVTVGVVKNGAPGAKGEPGAVGEKGEAGKGLALVSAIECKGSIEGWLEKSSYEIEFHQSEFETGDTFLTSSTSLKRGEEVVNKRSASAFVMSGEKKLHDGLFSMIYTANGLEVESKGGIKSTLPCKEMK